MFVRQTTIKKISKMSIKTTKNRTFYTLSSHVVGKVTDKQPKELLVEVLANKKMRITTPDFGSLVDVKLPMTSEEILHLSNLLKEAARLAEEF